MGVYILASRPRRRAVGLTYDWDAEKSLNFLCNLNAKDVRRSDFLFSLNFSTYVVVRLIFHFLPDAPPLTNH